MQYTLIRSKRRTLALHITPEAGLEVRAPLKMPLKRIEDFIAIGITYNGGNLILDSELASLWGKRTNT